MNPFAGPGATPSRRVRPCVAQLRHALPDGLAGVAGAVGVVQQQQVEALDAAALEAALGRHAQVAGVVARTAQRSIGEARKALRRRALALVEVVTDRADEAVGVAVSPASARPTKRRPRPAP